MLNVYNSNIYLIKVAEAGGVLDVTVDGVWKYFVETLVPTIQKWQIDDNDEEDDVGVVILENY